MRAKIHIRYILVLVALLIPSIYGSCQNYSQDMEKIMNTYKRGNISFHVKYRFYPYDSIHRATDSMNASCSMSGQASYYKIVSGGKVFEYVRNSYYYFVIDYTQQAIAVKKNSAAIGQAWDISKIDSLMHSRFSHVTYKNAGKNEGEYDVDVTNGPWNKFKIVFNKSNFSIVKISMYSSSKGKMAGQSYSKPMISISYTDYTESLTDKDIFSESKFFTVAGDNITLMEGYKKFKVLNYLKKQS